MQTSVQGSNGDLSALLERVRELVETHLIPAEDECDRTASIPDELLDRMRDCGLFGMSVPKAYGGLGLSHLDQIRVLFELCRAAPGYRTVIAATIGLGSKAILSDGTDSQREYWLRKIATGRAIVAFALTEPDSGSDAKGIATSAVRDGDGWILNGTKRFVSNAAIAQLLIVVARTGDGKRVSAFLVDRDAPGINLRSPWTKMGQRASQVNDVEFVDCRVAANALLGEQEGNGFKIAMKAIDDARLHMSAVAVGLSRRLIDESIGYATRRRQFGQAIAEYQLIQAMLADSEADTRAARALLEQTASRRDRGEDVTLDAACCKYFSTEAVWRVADRALQIHGGLGYVRESAVERLFRDARVLRILDGTSQIMQLIIAREVLRSAAVPSPSST